MWMLLESAYVAKIYINASFIIFKLLFLFVRDCIATAFVNSFTSIFSGVVIFSYLGYMAKIQNKDISDVADEGKYIKHRTIGPKLIGRTCT